MGVVNDGRGDASLLSGHQDPAPNFDAARLRLDRPAITKGNQDAGVCSR